MKFRVIVSLFAAICILPLLFSITGSSLTVSAQSYVLINADTNEVLASSGAHVRRSMASTTKIMTALILAELNTPEKTVVTTKEMVTVEGSSMGLLPGDTVSYKALMAGLLLASGNDAANTVAIAVAGSVPKFAEMMNRRAAEIGMKNTNFVTPSGLDSDEHYSTAYDMALLASVAMKNETIREIVSCEKMTVTFGEPPYDRVLYNHNKLLSSYEYCIGIKTGYTKKSGRCLVSAARKNGCTVIAVTLNAPDDWNDHEELLEYGLSKVEATDITYNFKENCVNVVGSDIERVKIGTERVVIASTQQSSDNIEYQVMLPPFLYAPLDSGQVVGRINYMYNGDVIKVSDIYALETVENSVKRLTLYDCFKLYFIELFKFL